MKLFFTRLLFIIFLLTTVSLSAQVRRERKTEPKEERERERREEREKEAGKKHTLDKDKREVIKAGKEEADNEEGEEGENEEYDGPDKAAEFEFNRTKDPATGKVPRERLLIAIERAYQSKSSVLKRGYSNRLIAGATWQERGPYTDVVGASNGNKRANSGVTSGRVRAIWVDIADATNKTVWIAGVDGGLWKTTDITASTANWAVINDNLSNLAVTDITQNPANSNVMYFCTGEWCYNSDAVKGNGVFRSTDHGVTWTQLSSTTGYGYCARILCDYVGNVYLATRGNGLLRSSDGGNSWTTITPTGVGTNICDLDISSTTGPGRLHMVAGIFSTQAYRYTDIPATASTASGWNSPVTPFPSYANRAEIACEGNLLYALPADGSNQVPTIYKSTDGGANWAATAGQPTTGWGSGQAWYALAVDINPANSNEVVIGGLEPYKSVDGGISWNKIANWTSTTGQYVHADIHKILWFDNGNKLLFGCDGGVHFSSDGGTTIRDRNVGLRIKQFYSCAIHPTAANNYFLAGAQDNGTHKLTSAGISSSVEVTGGDGGLVAIDQDQPQYQFSAYLYNQYHRSTDGGATWSSVNLSGTEGLFINPYDYDNLNNRFYASYTAGQYLLWSDPQTGSTTSAKTIAAFNGGSATAIFVSPYTSNRVYFGTTGGRIVAVNNANAATPTEFNLTAPSGMSGSVSCINTGTSDQYLIASFSNYGISNVWVSVNGGTSWTAIDGNLPDMPVRWCMFYPSDNTKAIIATETGVWTTDLVNGSSTVWDATPSFPTVRTDMLKYRKSDGTLVAATHGRGLWTTSLAVCSGTPAASVINESSVCSGSGLTLTLNPGYQEPGITYQWAYATTPGGTYTNLSTAETQATGNLTSTTYYKCTITCSGSGLSYTTPEKAITINPVATISATSNSPVCATQTLNLAGTSNQGGATYSWSGPNNFTSTQLSPSITNVTNAAAGTYILTATYGGCISTASMSVTVNSAPPAATGVTICQGGTGSLTASATCSGYTNAGNTLSGTWNAATDPTAARLNSIVNSTSCSFSTTTRNYTAVNFQVSVTGSYTFEMVDNSSYDGMGYIATSDFIPGSCSTGTFVIGDDDSGPGNEPLMTATLTAGVTYMLVSTTYSGSNGTYSGSYQWTITQGSGGQIMLYSTSPVNWFTASSGGSAIGTGSSFNPVGVAGSGLSNTNTVGATAYYAACASNSGCRTAANFAIIAPPSLPVAGNGVRCSSGSVTITATPAVGETIDWYADASGGSPLLSGSLSYNTPNLSANTTYYAEARNTTTNCVSSSRTAVTASITGGSLASPTAVNSSRCGLGSVTISATPSTGETIDWYAASSGGSALSVGSTTFITPAINSTTTYYAEARNATTACISATRTAVVATVTTGIASPTGTGGSRCGTGTITISATPPGGATIDWFSSATGGTALLSGSTAFTTPSISSTTVYYAEARNTTTGCTSMSRTAVSATILNPASPSVTPAAKCGSGTVTLSATAPSGSVVDWYAAATGGTALLSGSNNYTTPSITATTDYYAQSRNTSTGCTSMSRTMVTATINSIPAKTSANSGFSCTPTTITFEGFPGTGETIDWYTAATGGTIHYTGATFSEFISTTTYYYAEVRNIATGCVSASRTAVPGSIYQPALPTAGNASRCGTGSVDISATPGTGETIDWYASATGGTALSTGSAIYTTPSLSTTTTYYAEARNTSMGCISPSRTAVTATINSVPTAPTALDGARCGTGTVTISATPSAGEAIDWYAAASGGTALLTGSNNYTTPSISSTTTYYAEARNTTSGCKSATRTAVVANVNSNPSAPTGLNAARCGTGTVIISATPSAGETIDWYAAASGGTALVAGSTSYTTASISSTTTYYAEARNTTSGCKSATRTAVVATVNSNPSAPTGVNATRCGTGTVIISATPSAGETIDWYAAATGGTALATGSTSYTTPSISSTTTYYAEARNTISGCKSATRTAVVATVNSNPSVPTGIDAARCGTGTVIISATPSAGETIDWYAAATGGTALVTGSTSYTTSSISSTSTYYAEARNTTSGCKSATRTAVVATVNSTPSVPMGTDAARCGTGTVNISATPSAGETIDWYAAATGGTALVTGSTSYTTSSLSSTTIYYAEARNITTGCKSATRTAVVATVNSIPSVPPGIDAARCGTGTVNISATPSAGETIDWYAAASGGTALVTGSTSYTTPSLSSTTTYYAEARNTTSGCKSATRTAVIATVNLNPLAPAGVNAARCGTGTVNISATPSAGETIDWYAAASGGTTLVTGSTSYITPSISSTTTYYAEATNTTSGCKSATRTAVVATVNAATSSTSTVTLCSNEVPYRWNNANYSASGDYTIHLTNAAGCDSATTLHLVVKAASVSTTNASVCSSQLPYRWNNVNYTSGGSYTIHLVNEQGCDSAATLNLTVKATSESVTNISICSDQLPYTWNGENYSATGTYTAHLVNAAGCDSSAVLNLTVNETPVVDAGTYPVVGVNDPVVTLTGTPVGGTFSGVGVAGNVFNPAVAGPGEHVITYQYTNASNCSGSAQVTIKVVDASCTAPPYITDIAGSFTACGLAGTSSISYYSAEAVPNVTYRWFTSTANMQIVSGQASRIAGVTFNNSFTSGTLSITATNSCGTSIRSFSITKKVPATPGAISGDANPCAYTGSFAGTKVTYPIRKVQGATSYIWTLPAGVTVAGGSSPLVTSDTAISVVFPAVFSTGQILVQAKNECGVSAARSLTLTSKAPATPGTIAGAVDICEAIATNSNVTYSIKKVAGAASYEWLPAAGATVISHAADTSIVLSFPSSYATGTLSVRAISGCGNSLYKSLTIVKKLPSAPGNIIATGDICTSMFTGTTRVTYSIPATTSLPVPSHYTWTLAPAVAGSAVITGGSGVTSNATPTMIETTGLSIQVQYSGSFTNGTLTVRGVVDCGEGSAKILSLKKPLPPTPALPTASEAPCIGMPSAVTYTVTPSTANADVYIWSSPAGTQIAGSLPKSQTRDTTTSNSITVAYPPSFSSGNVTVKVKSICGISSTASLRVTADTCIAERMLSARSVVSVAEVFPNPNAGEYTIRITTQRKEDAVIQVINIYGQVVDQMTGINRNGIIVNTVHEKQLAAGAYIVKYKLGPEVNYVRMVITK